MNTANISKGDVWQVLLSKFIACALSALLLSTSMTAQDAPAFASLSLVHIYAELPK